MHVKLNVINLFNRLSLLANQTASALTLSSLPESVIVNHTQNSIHNIVIDDVKTLNDIDCGKADVANNNLANQKFIMSSSLQLHEDDLSRIDVKSLVSDVVLLLRVNLPRCCFSLSSFFLIPFDTRRKHHFPSYSLKFHNLLRLIDTINLIMFSNFFPSS